MLQNLLRGVFDSATATVLSPVNFLLCLGCALLAGFFLAFLAMQEGESSRSFITTLALLPAIVCVVIMMVNGNLGAGVAVAGTFSLIRFRSAPGTASEISMIFLAMSTGLLSGMGYLGYCILFALIMGGISYLCYKLGFGQRKNAPVSKTLHITIPEDLDYTGVFDDLFETYTTQCTLTSVKTTNMGSLFRLQYDLTLKDAAKENELINALRCRNGNLEISISAQQNKLLEL
jgi:hypothetical protein